MKPTLLFLLLIVLLTKKSVSQEVVSVIFKQNISSLAKEEQEKLDNIPFYYDLYTMDSIHIIGYADTVGDSLKNLQLSHKRATVVHSYCSNFLPENIPIKVIARGELKLGEVQRKVDFIMFNQHENELNNIPTIKIRKKPKKCFFIDCNLIKRCYVSEITIKNKQYVQLETKELNKKKRRYTGRIINGEFKYQRLRWKQKTTGENWWRKKRFVALVLKEDYERFKIFTFQNNGCAGVGENFYETKKIVNKSKCCDLDYPIMNNSQLKGIFFNLNYMKVRTPKKYVNLEKKYIESCESNKKITWKTKKFFGRDKYYYTKIRKENKIYLQNSCCDSVKDYLFYKTSCCKIRTKEGIFLFNESYLLEKKLTTSIGIGWRNSLFFRNKDILIFKASYLFNNKINLTATYNYPLLEYYNNSLLNLLKWSDKIKTNDYTTILYTGSDLYYIFDFENNNTLSQDLHLGVSFSPNFTSFLFPQIYAQYGLNKNYTNMKLPFSGRLTFGIKFYM